MNQQIIRINKCNNMQKHRLILHKVREICIFSYQQNLHWFKTNGMFLLNQRLFPHRGTYLSPAKSNKRGIGRLFFSSLSTITNMITIA